MESSPAVGLLCTFWGSTLPELGRLPCGIKCGHGWSFAKFLIVTWITRLYLLDQIFFLHWPTYVPFFNSKYNCVIVYILLFQLNYVSEMSFQASICRDWLHLLFITAFYFMEWRYHNLFNHLLTEEHLGCFVFSGISENPHTYIYGTCAIISVG